jgi:hypothetical protein
LSDSQKRRRQGESQQLASFKGKTKHLFISHIDKRCTEYFRGKAQNRPAHAIY